MLCVKLTQSLYREIEKEAAAHKMNVSEYVRHLIVEETPHLRRKTVQSLQVELKLQLGEYLGNEIMKMANRLSLTPELWLQIFLAKGNA